MVQMFSFFKTRNAIKRQAAEIYRVMSLQARQPIFYECYGVPDSVAGRFEMVALHGFMIWDRLQEAGEYAQAQALFDHMFKDMELALREMGVGDLSVPRHMKRLMTGFKGRALAYRAAQDDGTLDDVLARNLYATLEEKPGADVVAALRDYVAANIAALAEQDVALLCQGQIAFQPIGRAEAQNKKDQDHEQRKRVRDAA